MPSPVPSSGFLPLSTVLAALAVMHELLAEPATDRDAPTLRGLVSCRSRPWSRPSELSLPEEPCPFSRAAASLRVHARPPPARWTRDVRARFHRGADSWPWMTRGPSRLESRDQSSPRALGRPPCALLPRLWRLPFPKTPGSPDCGRHAHFEALLPSRVRSLRDPNPGRGEIRRSVLSWAVFPSRVYSSTSVGPVSREGEVGQV